MGQTYFTSTVSWLVVQAALLALKKLFSETVSIMHWSYACVVFKGKLVLGGISILHFVFRFVYVFKLISFSRIALESCQKYLLANVDVPVQVKVKSFPI